MQSRDGLVPNGFIAYLLITRVPGVALNYFWKFSPIIREQIRSAFKVAWEYVILLSF
jgi:hypothetical protein